MQTKPDISVVLGSKNRKNLIKATIESIRNNGFSGTLEIIVIDGGSKDGTCDWLAQQRDVFTIVQPNFQIQDTDDIKILAHSWGNFMNIAFKYAKADWIVMVSDDLLLEKGCLQKGYDFLNMKVKNGEKVGGGAFYFREYPRQDYYRIINLPGNNININHGFYQKKALENIDYIEEEYFNFYYGDSDLSLRLSLNGWQVYPLENCFANHLVHLPKFSKKNKISPATKRDTDRFRERYANLPLPDKDIIISRLYPTISTKPFWKFAFKNCILGIGLKYYDKKYNKASQ
ncbi:glycosyltransferase family 2 protein [Empedobacter sp.]|uniref:glycosyltransferase family 2 protein n=1 Tax=Empedobacter sp. TaxID=1927715 RepID=UPI0028A85EC8|nr:glycosyltransferase [Empedobacter sp.]